MNNKKLKQELQDLITEIEQQSIKFDSSNWHRYQKICVDWGDKVAPFIKPNKDSHKQFTNELEKLRAVIYDPILPSDYSGTPLQNSFNKMVSEAKQQLHELEHKIKPKDSFDVVRKVWDDGFWGKVLVLVVAGIILIFITFLINRFIFSATIFPATTQQKVQQQEQAPKLANQDASGIANNHQGKIK